MCIKSWGWEEVAWVKRWGHEEELVVWMKSWEQEEVLVKWMKSWGTGGRAGGADEELWAGCAGAGAVDEELGGGRRCWWRG